MRITNTPKSVFSSLAIASFLSLHSAQAMEEQASFEEMPTDIISKCLSYLDKKERIPVSSVCKIWLNIINTEMKNMSIHFQPNKAYGFFDYNSYLHMKSDEYDQSPLSSYDGKLWQYHSLFNCTVTGLSDYELPHLIERFSNMTSLDLFAAYMTDSSFIHLTNLTDLTFSNNHRVTDSSFKMLTNLKSLTIYNLDKITDDSISLLTNLTSLGVTYNNEIAGSSFIQLPLLTDLDLTCNRVTLSTSVSQLTNLTRLNLSFNSVVATSSLNLLTALTELDLTHNDVIREMNLHHLTNLTNLKK